MTTNDELRNLMTAHTYGSSPLAFALYELAEELLALRAKADALEADLSYCAAENSDQERQIGRMAEELLTLAEGTK